MAQISELWACSVWGELRRKESVKSLNSVAESRPREKRLENCHNVPFLRGKSNLMRILTARLDRYSNGSQ